MTAALRKGWCPGALRPMAAKDGLLVRLRITAGLLSAATAEALADLAARHGNGLIDLSARGNLQLRGVRDDALPGLLAALGDLGLVDADAAAESVRNVIASPLAGLGASDIRPLVRALEARLTRDPSLHRLPSKFGFLIDDGGAPTLAGVGADVRFDRHSAADVFEIGLGGIRGKALVIGTCAAETVVERAAAIAGALVARGLPATAARMRHWIAADGPDAVAAACGGSPRATSSVPLSTLPGDLVGLQTLDGVKFAGLGVPFGQLEAGLLRRAAHVAATTTAAEIRLTPWRVLMIPGATAPLPPDFITDPSDPRLLVAACPGADGCERGTTATRRDAATLAARLGARAGRDILVHVSGCEKRCTKPSPTPLTLVARHGRYDVVARGPAGATPVRRGLDLEAAAALVEAYGHSA